MFCAPILVLAGTEGAWSIFHILLYHTRFRLYRGRQVHFSCFVLPDSFSAVPMASGLVFMFCGPGLIFGCTKRAGSSFHVWHSLTHFGRYRGHKVQFSYFALRESFSAVPRALVPILIFRNPGPIFDGTEGVRSNAHVLRSRTRFPRYIRRRVQFSYFALLDSFWIVPRASGPVFIFCAPGLIFGGTEGAKSSFHISLS
jgi:hypothetical protein